MAQRREIRFPHAPRCCMNQDHTMPSQGFEMCNAKSFNQDSEPRPLQPMTAGEIGRFPGLNGWMRAALTLIAHISVGALNIGLPDGRKIRFEGAVPGDTGTIMVHDAGFAKKILLTGGVGFAEAYLDGLWDTPDLQTLLGVFAANNTSIGARARGNRLASVLERFRNRLVQRNSRSGARRNIEYHYDLGNDFYALWLDAGMTYSSALFENATDGLERAQYNKFRALAERIGLASGHHLLEIGCGWGGFSEFAAKQTGCHVTGITISQEQYNFARKRIFDCGLAEKVSIVMQDYRDIGMQYDRIASIEMFEAVGEAYWPVFFNKLYGCLKPDGVAGLQLITIADQHFDSYRRGGDFIQRYIFPGGMLISPSVLRRQVADAKLRIQEHAAFGRDYAKTLRHWHENFQRQWPEIEKLGFDNRFRRMWSYYLAYCQAGFMSQNTDVIQMTLSRA